LATPDAGKSKVISSVSSYLLLADPTLLLTNIIAALVEKIVKYALLGLTGLYLSSGPAAREVNGILHTISFYTGGEVIPNRSCVDLNYFVFTSAALLSIN
jgi:hypothetical protein